MASSFTFLHEAIKIPLNLPHSSRARGNFYSRSVFDRFSLPVVFCFTRKLSRLFIILPNSSHSSLMVRYISYCVFFRSVSRFFSCCNFCMDGNFSSPSISFRSPVTFSYNSNSALCSCRNFFLFLLFR